MWNNDEGKSKLDQFCLARFENRIKGMRIAFSLKTTSQHVAPSNFGSISGSAVNHILLWLVKFLGLNRDTCTWLNTSLSSRRVAPSTTPSFHSPGFRVSRTVQFGCITSSTISGTYTGNPWSFQAFIEKLEWPKTLIYPILKRRVTVSFACSSVP